MKKCTKCKEMKDLDQFNKNKSRSDGLGNTCRECMKVVRTKYYLANKELVMQKNKVRKQSLRDQVWQYKATHCCVDCQESDPIVLEFDHISDDKVGNVSAMIERGFSWDTLLKEIEKCEVRCANCHRRKTAERGNWAVMRV